MPPKAAKQVVDTTPAKDEKKTVKPTAKSTSKSPVRAKLEKKAPAVEESKVAPKGKYSFNFD